MDSHETPPQPSIHFTHAAFLLPLFFFALPFRLSRRPPRRRRPPLRFALRLRPRPALKTAQSPSRARGLAPARAGAPTPTALAALLGRIASEAACSRVSGGRDAARCRRAPFCATRTPAFTWVTSVTAEPVCASSATLAASSDARTTPASASTRTRSTAIDEGLIVLERFTRVLPNASLVRWLRRARQNVSRAFPAIAARLLVCGRGVSPRQRRYVQAAQEWTLPRGRVSGRQRPGLPRRSPPCHAVPARPAPQRKPVRCGPRAHEPV